MADRIFDEALMRKLDRLSLHYGASVSNVYSGGRRSKAAGSTVEFSNFREYLQGDDFRKIDWNAYARFEKFFIKLFLDEKQLNTHIFCDVSKSMDFGTPAKLFAAMRIAAAFSYVSVKTQDLVSVHGLSGSQCEILAEGINSVTAFYKGLEKMESVKAHGTTCLTKALRDCRSIRSGDGISVLISDLMSDENFEDALNYLLYQRQQTVLIHVLSREEIEPKFEGRIRFLDSESSTYCDVNVGNESLDCYKKALEDYLTRIRSFCMKRGVTYIPIISDENIDEVLLGKGYTAGILQ